MIDRVRTFIGYQRISEGTWRSCPSEAPSESHSKGTIYGRMTGMTKGAKLKLSVTISADVLALVDEDARRLGATRSGTIELWLRRAAAGNVEREIEQATVAYYRSLRGEEQKEDEALSKALSRGARRVSYDESIEPRGRRVAR